MPDPPSSQSVANDSCQFFQAGTVSAAKELILKDGRHTLQIANEGDERLHYRFGTDGSVDAEKFAAGIGDAVVTSGTTVNVPIPQGSTHIAFITDANTTDATFQAVG